MIALTDAIRAEMVTIVNFIFSRNELLKLPLLDKFGFDKEMWWYVIVLYH